MATWYDMYTPLNWHSSGTWTILKMYILAGLASCSKILIFQGHVSLPAHRIHGRYGIFTFMNFCEWLIFMVIIQENSPFPWILWAEDPQEKHTTMANDKFIRPGDLKFSSCKTTSRFTRWGFQVTIFPLEKKCWTKNIATKFIETSFFQFWTDFCETCLTHGDLFVLNSLFLDKYLYSKPFPFIHLWITRMSLCFSASMDKDLFHLQHPACSGEILQAQPDIVFKLFSAS